MSYDPLHEKLRFKLQSMGAVRQEAWTAILAAIDNTELKADESFIRSPGTLAYIAGGLLKEYDARNRKKPAIINFIEEGQCFYSNKFNQAQYLKACMPTTVLSLTFEGLMQLYPSFKELKAIYDQIYAECDEATAYRQLILEQHKPEQKILLFKNKHAKALPFLKKKDISNYLHLNYSHLVSIWNKNL